MLYALVREIRGSSQRTAKSAGVLVWCGNILCILPSLQSDDPITISVSDPEVRRVCQTCVGSHALLSLLRAFVCACVLRGAGGDVRIHLKIIHFNIQSWNRRKCFSFLVCTELGAYKVRRRFRDFEWLYQVLHGESGIYYATLTKNTNKVSCD